MHKSVRVFGAAVAMAVLTAAGAQPSKADSLITFVVSGTFNTGSMNGRVTFDETNNTMPSVDINAPGTGAGPFIIPGLFSNPPDGSTATFVGIADASGDYLFLQFPTPTVANVSGCDGGSLMVDDTAIYVPASGSFDFLSAGSLTPAPELSSLLLTGAAGLALVALSKMRQRRTEK